MVLRNYVTLEDGVPARMHFVDHHLETRDITDPLTRRPKSVNTLVFDVSRLNGGTVSAQFSTTAESLAQQFSPYLGTKSYTQYDFVITKRGAGFQTTYSIQAVPLAASPTRP